MASAVGYDLIGDTAQPAIPDLIRFAALTASERDSQAKGESPISIHRIRHDFVNVRLCRLR
jgi:hypothetical protein